MPVKVAIVRAAPNVATKNMMPKRPASTALRAQPLTESALVACVELCVAAATGVVVFSAEVVVIDDMFDEVTATEAVTVTSLA